MKLCIEIKAGTIETFVDGRPRGEGIGGLRVNSEYMKPEQIELFLLSVVLPELNRMSREIEDEYLEKLAEGGGVNG